MDRRQQKTRKAIYDAFALLLTEKNYNHITVQNIIDVANVGRTTFYAHFETKDELLKSVCEEFFGHIITRAIDSSQSCDTCLQHHVPHSVFCHILQHLQKNDHHVLGLLSCRNNELFLQYFKSSMNELIRNQFVIQTNQLNVDVPQDFLINHMTVSFVEMVNWWIKGNMKQTPEELDQYFRAVIEPIGICSLEEQKK